MVRPRREPPREASGRSAPSAPAPHRPSLRRVAPFLVLTLLAALYCGTGMVQAVDTWISLAGGRHIASHGVDDADPFSFDSRPPAVSTLGPSPSAWARARAWLEPTGWINQNWLTHLLLFELVDAFGLNALAAFRLGIYLVVGALLVLASRIQGARIEVAALAATAALLALRPFAEFRAQEFTTLLTAAMLVLLGVSVRRSPRVLWGAVPLVAVWCNLHGGFIFGLLALGVYAVAGWLPRGAGTRWLVLPPASRGTAAAVTLASVAVTVAASPYRVANLTHPLAITVGAEAGLWRRVNEWLPAITPGARLGEVVPFFVLLGTTAVVLTLALRRGGAPQARARASTPVVGWQLDLGALALAAVTTAMALRSMRFVPLAAVTLAPVLAAAIEELLAREARRADRAGQRFARGVRVAPFLAGLTVLALAALWCMRFSQAYVAPWPYTATPVSLFERMTWAHRFRGVGEFLRRNAVTGRAFNVWEEGGVLMWEQRPPTGSERQPLAVFIDGRAQAAYPASIVPEYIELDVGGPTGVDAVAEGRSPSQGELEAMGGWVEAQLRRSGVAIVVAPEERLGDGVFRALATRGSWHPVFRDQFHLVLVDTGDAEGRRLDSGVASGAVSFPDESVRLLTLAARSAASPAVAGRREALAAAERSFELRPTAVAVATALQAGAAPELADEIARFARAVVADYVAGETRYEHEAGFLERARAAMLAAELLRSEALRRGQVVEAAELAALIARAGRAHERAMQRASWWG